ncbi:uncharacterized protein N7469_006245 [Penicillium citrinum]|uniref:Xylanolytic transcriptional activator regulatory domain-containing protein n=1 Tax=Penicillium citrinum TaxID=5077 RepID=A0A9W9NZX7_PENCI|nr:uncharacterized protein N7469_006245 [Penicillium citrinum]KAJ5231657.1 hypothetical protein N7469_006245 [Penicillium citrinum]
MSETNNSHACNECRRRKAREKDVPIDRLTRYRYLTEVEESLRIATQIIRDHGLDVDLDAELASARNGTNPSYASSHAKKEKVALSGGLKRPRIASDEPSLVRNNVPDGTRVEPNLFEPGLETILSDGIIEEAIPTDILPAASANNQVLNNADYDWDERDTEAQSCIDGMAALSIEEERPGYLGLASGASLLRLIQSHFLFPFSSVPAPFNISAPNSESPRLGANQHREIPSHQIEVYIASYFKEYHTNYPLVHQSLFMAQFHEIVPRPKHSKVLIYIVAAIGAFMSATTANDDDLILYQNARSHLSVEILEVGSLTLVQSLCLISNYLQKRDRPNSSHNYLGLAVRMAYGLGLHKDYPGVEGNLLYREIRRRTWWCLFIFDIGSTITFSRPLAIPSAGIDTKLPLNILETDLTASTLEAPANVDAPTIYTNVRVQSQFHLLTNHIYNRVISKPSPTAKEVIEWDDFYITKWLNLVPDYYKETATVLEKHRFPHAIMTWRYKHFRLIIYRPFFIQKALQINQQQTASLTSFTVPSTQIPPDQTNIDIAYERCIKESHETISSIDNFWKTARHTRMECWYALYFLFSATLVPVILLHNESQSLHSKSWQEDIDKAIWIIRGMVELSPFAGRCVETLERLRDGISSPLLAELGSTMSDLPSFSDDISQAPFAEMFSGTGSWFDAPGMYSMEEQLWDNDQLFFSDFTSDVTR